MDPEFTEVLAAFTPLQFVDPPAQREALLKLRAELPEPPWPEGVERTDRLVAAAGGHQVPVRVYTPVDAAADSGVVLWIHGGGFCIGHPDEDEPLCARLAIEASAVVVSVEYRLAPEHPYPAGLDDCHSVLLALSGTGWPDGPIVVAGASAGAGLAAALAQRSRDRGGPSIAGQVLLYPFLDATLSAPSIRTLADSPVFDAEDARICWEHYLGAARTDPPAHASPPAATDLSGLPPAYLLVAGADCLRDEAIDYAVRMQAAGVPTELHVFPEVPHAFSAVLPTATASRRARAELFEVAKRMMEGAR